MIAVKSTPNSGFAGRSICIPASLYRQCWSSTKCEGKNPAMIHIAPCFRSPGLTLGLAATLLSGCASDTSVYPSLAVRDVERIHGSFQSSQTPAAPLPESPPSADLLERLAQLQSAAASAHRLFMAAVPETERLLAAAAGTDVTSNRWATAQVALSSLESARSQAAVPLGDLDLLHADAAIELQQREVIQEVRAAVTALIAEEDAILAGLRGRLR
ncbi:hypothetical protein [Allopontixanthobacter sp.]|uniref:hypothetical protein n=1 Tax=Allopontixanthobacter sp. TaxID=2906452 RepID=UPI002ABAF65C|nr:hypothetical protein [Allopontixanthobacter sp.]MDZ4308427.1 hypothetical protein [Allopontixanthobacter sp.]